MSGDDDRNDEVGFKKPPRHTRFKPGQSGNPRGRPKQQAPEPLDVAQVLEEPILVTKRGRRQRMSPYEVGLRRLTHKAINEKNLNAALEFLKECDAAEVFADPPRVGGVIFAPPDPEVQKIIRDAKEERERRARREQNGENNDPFVR